MADQLIRATAADGGIRAVGVITTRLTEEARRPAFLCSNCLGSQHVSWVVASINMKRAGSRVNIRIKAMVPWMEFSWMLD